MIKGKDIDKLKDLATEYVSELPKFAKPMAMRYILRASKSKRYADDQGFLQFVEKSLKK
jgi:hypothetical protein